MWTHMKGVYYGRKGALAGPLFWLAYLVNPIFSNFLRGKFHHLANCFEYDFELRVIPLFQFVEFVCNGTV